MSVASNAVRLPLLALMSAILAGCSSAPPSIKPSIDPGYTPQPGINVPRDQPPIPSAPKFSDPPDVAFRRHKMPLYSTGVPEFLRAHPTYDGRGVIIGILDSGIDPGVAGLDSTTTADRKILDLRDVSGEGRIPLTQVTPRHDSVTVAGVTLTGFGRMALFNAQGPYYGGILREITLGKPPGADVDGNGFAGDSLVVLVTKASEGWIAMIDSDRDGSLMGERPVRDYLVSRETIGWARKGQTPRLNLAVNLSDSAEVPLLDLFFDTYSHGTHVAGIATGHDMYGVKGFDGVAPGAQLLGIKIANDAQAGITTTGSIMRGIDYAVRFASRRRIPLVINLSFGVGNEAEGTARIDQLIDSVLAAHPDLVLTVSAGNDGPGLSTVAFPGSAARALTVGAILPGNPDDSATSRDEPIAYYSSRGGEVAKPDMVAPGTAYSTVPLWDRGGEVASGTSMAAPHAAGLAALLLSAVRQENGAIDARTLKQALMVTARPIAAESFLDQGAGIPDIGAAYRWVNGDHHVPDIQVRVPRADSARRSAAFRPQGLRSSADTSQEFQLIRMDSESPATFALRSSTPWLVAPSSVTITGRSAIVTLRYRPELIIGAGTLTGVVSGWPADTMAGPAFRLINTIGAAAIGGRDFDESAAVAIPAGGQRRLFISADSGRPFEASARIGGNQPILVFLQEPDGMPVRGTEPQIAGAGQEEVSFRLDGSDVVSGPYELVAVAPPTQSSSARFRIKTASVGFDARRDPSGVMARVTGLEPASDQTVELGLIGGERLVRIVTHGLDTVTTRFTIPGWATHAIVDLQMEPAQWSRFTDLGMTLLDSLGFQIASAPLNYAFGRLETEFDRKHSDEPVSLQLFPALAEPGSSERWTATLSIRLYAKNQVPLASAATGRPATTEDEITRFTMISPPWPLGDGFFPLGLLAVTQGGEVWTREVPLPEPAGPLMR